MIKRSEQRELPAVEGFGISLKAAWIASQYMITFKDYR